MVDPKKEADAPEAEKDMDDKSINDLLKEYAEEVKDKDLDEFLKDPTDDDAFEGDDGADDDDAVAAAPAKKSGGFGKFLMTLIVVGAAGAGAWVYLNKDSGMTNVMGGFTGEPLVEDTTMAEPSVMDTPLPAPEATPSMPDLTSDVAAAPTDVVANDIPSPTPIVNEAAPADTAALTPAVDPMAVSPVAAEVTPAAEAPVAEPVPATEPVAAADATTTAAAPVTAEAAQAVDDWMSSASDGMKETEAKVDAKLADAPAASEPAIDIAEVNAKPVTAAKTEDKVADAKPAAAKRAVSAYDDALAPPYVAIQSGKGSTSAQSADTTKAKMAPVVEGGAAANLQTTASDVAGYKRGSTAATEPSETRATGIYKDLVKNGGGAIDLPGLSVNVPNSAAQVPAPAVEYVETDAPLAIKGGKSVPPGKKILTTKSGSTVEATLPSGMKAEAEPKVQASPVIPVEPETPAVMSPRVQSAPKASASVNATATAEGNSAQGVLRAAQAAEASGDAAKAIGLYQRALEIDAVYGDGKSIDRGAVYDRIGALRAQ